jgi:hypothetical protein
MKNNSKGMPVSIMYLTYTVLHLHLIIPLLPFAGLKFVVNISISPLLGVKTMAFDCALGVCCVNTNSPPV